MAKQISDSGYLAGKLKKITPEKATSYKEDKEWYPSIHLTSKDLPEIKEWEVGKTYHLVLEVKEKSKTEETPGSISASFDIVKIGIKK